MMHNMIYAVTIIVFNPILMCIPDLIGNIESLTQQKR